MMAVKRRADDPNGPEAEELTAEEHKLYDRQIRLWGLDAQKRLNKFRVCIAGLTGLGAEVAKNVILSGVARVALLDHKNICKDDFRSQFMVTPDDLDKNRALSSLRYARRLNPMVNVTAADTNLLDQDDAFLQEFDLVVVCDFIAPDAAFALGDRCRSLNVKLMVGQVVAGLGYFMSDLGAEFRFVQETTTTTQAKVGITVKKTKHEDLSEQFAPLRKILDVAYVDKRNGGALNRRTARVAFQFQLLLEHYRQQEATDASSTLLPTKADLAKAVDEVAKRTGAPADKFDLDSFDKLMSLEPGPVCAVLGGILGQEVVKVASQNYRPFNNVFLFDSDKCVGTAHRFQ